jgi:M6 family metalloprotease-like protein
MGKRFLWLLICLPWVLGAAPIRNLPTEVTQPDGTTVQLLSSGDEFFNYWHDTNDYTIIRSPKDGWLYYAQEEKGLLVPSGFRIGAVDPRQTPLTPSAHISEAEYQRRVRNLYPRTRDSRCPQTGTVNNLAIYIRFSDQSEFGIPRSEYEAKFNAVGDEVISLRDYYQEVSYEQIDIVTSHFPTCSPTVNLSYQDTNPRAYYMPFDLVTNPDGYMNDDIRTEREHTLLANACNAISDQVPAGLDVDMDDDGYVDNVCFIIRGPHTAWANLLWAHRWVLWAANASINGAMVGDYTLQPENQNDVNVLCHEMFHSIGAPDLYHYNFDGLSPSGLWDVMESGTGHMCTYMKYLYGGWISTIPTVSEGVQTLNPLTSATNQCCKIQAGDQYFVFEYRRNTPGTYESSLPGSGLLIWRVDPSLDGNADGPPDGLYLYRPGGSQTQNGNIVEAPFSADAFRTTFNRTTDPAAWLNYNGVSNISISDISEAGEAISFTISVNPPVLPPVVAFAGLSEGAVLIDSPTTVHATASQLNGAVQSVELLVDDVVIGEDFSAPYTFEWNPVPGDHNLVLNALSTDGQTGVCATSVRVIDPDTENWFRWYSDDPEYEPWGRGSIPIQVAVEFDLGTTEYEIQAISINMEDDPWGDPEFPGMFSASIHPMEAGVISGTVLYDLGAFFSDMNGRFSVEIPSHPVITGRVALVMDLGAYQNMYFDIRGATGHSWITEPDRPWTDALARGALGAADIGLRLQQPGVSGEVEITPLQPLSLEAGPNPFNPATTLSFSLPEAGPVELTIYNLRGQKVRTLLHESLTAGSHVVSWDGCDDTTRPLSSGVYACRLRCGNRETVRKITLMK